MTIGSCAPQISLAKFKQLLANRETDTQHRYRAGTCSQSTSLTETHRHASHDQISDCSAVVSPAAGKILSHRSLGSPKRRFSIKSWDMLWRHRKLCLPSRLKAFLKTFASAAVKDCPSSVEEQTLIIFDWDDTLLNSSFVESFPEGQIIPESTQSHVRCIEQRAVQLLEIALSLGHTYIITNARAGWVEESAARYMPSVLPLLQTVQIISARSTQESNCNGDVSQWKVKAFMEVSRYFDADIPTNVVSIGDSEYEKHAANILGSRFAKGYTKTVKLQDSPTLKTHRKELDCLVSKLHAIVKKACDLEVAFKIA